MSKLSLHSSAVSDLYDAAIAYVDADNALDVAVQGSDIDDLREDYMLASANLNKACHLLAMTRDACVENVRGWP